MTPVLAVDIQAQPDDTTCGPTCLQAVYRFYDDELDLAALIAETPSLEHGGTLAVHLACHALRRGYDATIHTYNLQLFDPSWFDAAAAPVDLADKLRAQAHAKHGRRLHAASDGYVEFLRLGGRVVFEPLTRDLIERLLLRGRPLLTGLCATYLYQEPREIGATNKPDDVRGTATGHFVVLCGYDRGTRQINIADPLHPNPLSTKRHYAIHIDIVLGAILLGVMTYDANLLTLAPRRPAGDRA